MEQFNTIPLTTLTGTFCACMGVEPPKYATTKIDELVEYITSRCQNGKVDRVIIYNPDAIGDYIYRKYYDKFASVRKHLKREQPMLSMIPPKTPVCFASIYSGATPEQHGISKYVKPVLTIDTIFDALIRAGKKPCIVSVAGQSMDKIFRERDMDYYSTADDRSAVDKAIELVKEDKYDFICVYNQEHDSVMHITHPQSRFALRALDHYCDNFDRLATAVKENWKNHDTLVGFATDHGTHREWYGLGQHGKNIPKDMNITHLYDIFPKQQ